MPLEQRPRDVAERAGGRAQAGVLEHAAPDEDVLGARVVVVDRVLHLEDEHRQDLAEALVGQRAARRVPPPRRRSTSTVDEVDAGDDPGGAAANAVEQVDAAVAAPDRELVAEAVDPVADLGRPGLELHEPDVLGRRTDPLHDARARARRRGTPARPGS